MTGGGICMGKGRECASLWCVSQPAGGVGGRVSEKRPGDVALRRVSGYKRAVEAFAQYGRKVGSRDGL